MKRQASGYALIPQWHRRSSIVVVILTMLPILAFAAISPSDYPQHVPGRCLFSDQFDCDPLGDKQCVPLRVVRDCVKDCLNGADETCGQNQTLCDVGVVGSHDPCGKCVATYSALTQCLDRKWKGLCRENNTYQCRTNENCVLTSWLNDGENDCGDDSDEDPCINGYVTCGPYSPMLPQQPVPEEEFQKRFPGSCAQGQFDCLTHCIDQNQIRDCIKDCPDGMDEACWHGQARCPSPASCMCVDEDQIEAMCSSNNECGPGQFRCVTGGCIANVKVFDGVKHCSDGSDETFCTDYITEPCPTEKPCSYDPWKRNFSCGCPDDSVRTGNGVCRRANERPSADCADIQIQDTSATTGLYTIYRLNCPNSTGCPLTVNCDLKTNGGGYTLIQKRTSASDDFFQNWDDYRDGINKADEANYWIGNSLLYELTSGPNGTAYELLIKLWPATTNQLVEVQYSSFQVGSEAQNFLLTLGLLTQGPSDDMAINRNRPFGTRDRDTDQMSSVTCGVWLRSGWWFGDQCQPDGDLNVPYGVVPDYDHLNGIKWGNVRMNKVEMFIRPVGFTPPSLSSSPSEMHLRCPVFFFLSLCHFIIVAFSS
uniref:Fibrinogen C-terminal domain-containing protein n=1 Tax=Plectus sambesii TaxID=2011161 RepID=A0A914V0F0_9BILA